MKPTVISGGNGGDNTPVTANTNQAQSTKINPDPGQQNPLQQETSNTRDFPHFQSGFGFRPHFDNMFDDDDFGPHLRARMMRDPFAGFGGRKRCGFKPFDDDPYRDYFADLSDFFPGLHDPEWDTLRTRRRAPAQSSGGGATNARSNIFDHIPAEFRSYLPENFGFHQPASQEYSQSYPPQQQYYEAHPQPNPQEQQVPQPQQQYHQQYQNNPEQPAPRPKYCDAAIQTEHDSNVEPDSPQYRQGQNLHQPNLRNTTDLGQRSQQEGINEARSHSAPPVNNQNFASASPSAFSGPEVSQDGYYNSTGTDPRSPQQFSEQQPGYYQQQRPQAANPPPPPQRQYVHPQHQTAPQYQNAPPYQSAAPQYQNPQHQQYSQQQVPPRTQKAPQEDNGHVRHVPIFIEGRSEPFSSPPRQRKTHQQAQQVPPQPQAPQQQQQRQAPPPPQQHHNRPTPLNTQQAQSQAQQHSNHVPSGPQDPVPQTPHTAETINKIQGIQRDVLNLLAQVEQFTGTKQDKEYIYLDEMLTRNLLKLDTIDTDGKDSIRLARREAIKCIQAAINVLEAKAEENTKTAQGSVMEAQRLDAAEGEPNVIALPCSEAQRSFATTEMEPEVKYENQSDDGPQTQDQQAAEATAETGNESENKEVSLAEDAVQPEEPNQPDLTSTETQQPENAETTTEQPPEENQDIQSQQPDASGDAATLEPPQEQIEKSSSEKENKPPGSPKKKIVRKVKKVTDKKSSSPAAESTSDNATTTPPNKESDELVGPAETAPEDAK